MELFAYAIMFIVTNMFFMIREITIVVEHNHDQDKTPYEVRFLLINLNSLSLGS